MSEVMHIMNRLQQKYLHSVKKVYRTPRCWFIQIEYPETYGLGTYLCSNQFGTNTEDQQIIRALEQLEVVELQF